MDSTFKFIINYNPGKAVWSGIQFSPLCVFLFRQLPGLFNNYYYVETKSKTPFRDR